MYTTTIETMSEIRDNKGGRGQSKVNFNDTVPMEYKDLDGGDVEGMRRWEYESWELAQASSGLPEEEWAPFVPSDFEKGMEKENKKKIIKNLKKAKEETGKERWDRIDEERRNKEIKKAVRAAKKMRKEGKMRPIGSYFKK
jgi:hypothetical protein